MARIANFFTVIELSLLGEMSSSALYLHGEIEDRCLCLRTDSNGRANISNCNCLHYNQFTSPELWESGSKLSSQLYREYMHEHQGTFWSSDSYSYYSKNYKAWQGALEANQDHQQYFNAESIVDKIEDGVHLPPGRKYWIGLGNYSCTTGEWYQTLHEL